MYLVVLCCVQIVRLIGWTVATLDRAAQRWAEAKDKDDEWVDGWVRQERRLKEALALAKQQNAPTNPVEPDEERVDGWVRQERRLKEALALAKQQNAPTSPVDPDDEWVDGWVRQERRLTEALALAKQQQASSRQPGS